ncbi:MAG0490 family ComEA-like DNA-binding protein [[Mycoplasma] falconis]|uniref:MAG0490 family ComEA-like DNA-binding protein n=1 Tax=[Mycoplasma] falconis TaxID=92403 RepID=UPI0034D6F7B5
MQEVYISKKAIYIGITFLLSSTAILFTVGIVKYQKEKPDYEDKNEKIKINKISISGAVEYPGEYELKNGSILNDLLKLAILKSGANLENINKNYILKNKEKIYIPYLENHKKSIKTVVDSNVLINLKIKKNIAEKIYQFLVKNNYEVQWKDLLEISGVGEKTIEILQNNFLIEN